MRFEVDLAKFKKAVTLLSRVSSSKTSLPILSNILLKIEDSSITLSSTDLELALEFKLKTKTTGSGSITIPSRIFNDLISNLPDSEKLNLEVKNNKIFINSIINETYINALDSSDFPDLPVVESGNTLKLNAQELKDGLLKTSFVASRDETRPVLNGCLFKFNKNQLYIVATDGYRLAEKKINLDTNLEATLIIPNTTVQELIKIISSEEDNPELTLSYDETSIKFSIGEYQLVSRIIEGQYPDYAQIIPNSFTVKTKLNKAEFSSAIKLASLFARESAGSINISKDASDDFILITSDSNQVGENSSKVQVIESDGEASTTLNARYISDGLGVIDTNQMEFNYSQGVLPALIKPINDDSYIHIIMPLKS